MASIPLLVDSLSFPPLNGTLTGPGAISNRFLSVLFWSEFPVSCHPPPNYFTFGHLVVTDNYQLSPCGHLQEVGYWRASYEYIATPNCEDLRPCFRIFLPSPFLHSFAFSSPFKERKKYLLCIYCVSACGINVWRWKPGFSISVRLKNIFWTRSFQVSEAIHPKDCTIEYSALWCLLPPRSPNGGGGKINHLSILTRGVGSKSSNLIYSHSAISTTPLG